ncbi:unnamed protein product [Amoebophrya sp. A25]|nr:unnamed protein product [Amoebophrya sp. A25]|eukprot:GSA25T00008451001.1
MVDDFLGCSSSSSPRLLYPHEYGLQMNVVREYFESKPRPRLVHGKSSTTTATKNKRGSATPASKAATPKYSPAVARSNSKANTSASSSRPATSAAFAPRPASNNVVEVGTSPARSSRDIMPPSPQHLQMLLQHKLSDSITQWHLYHEIRTRGTAATNANQLPASSNIPEIGMQNQMLTVMKRAYWDSCRDKLRAGWNDGSGFEQVISRVEEAIGVMAGFFDRSPKRKRAFIEGGVDMVLLRQMVSNRAYDLAAFNQTLKQLQSMLAQLESPHQESLTRAHFDKEFFSKIDPHNYNSISNSNAEDEATYFSGLIVSALEHVFHKLDLVKSESENFYLAMLPQGERSKLERRQLNTMIESFGGRHPWMFDACMAEVVKERGKDPLSPTAANIEAFRSCTELYAFVARALFKDTPLSDEDVPIPLRVSLREVHALQNALQLTCLIGVVALLVSPVLGTPCALSNDELREFFGDCRKSLMSADLNRDGFFGDVEAALLRIFAKKGSPESDVIDISSVDPARAAQIRQSVTQLENITKKGRSAPIYDLLFTKMQKCILPEPSVLGEEILQQGTSDDNDGGIQIFDEPSVAINPLTVNAPTGVGGQTGTVAGGSSSSSGSRGAAMTAQPGLMAASNGNNGTSSAVTSAGATCSTFASSTSAPSATSSHPSAPGNASTNNNTSTTSATSNTTKPHAFFPNLPRARPNALGERPWYLSYAAEHLEAVERHLAEVIGKSWLCYEDYYRRPPKVVLKK